jgi:hypothetical protein
MLLGDSAVDHLREQLFCFRDLAGPTVAGDALATHLMRPACELGTSFGKFGKGDFRGL